MAEVNVSVQAYAKMLLHAAKYPHCSVNGVLLAEDTKAKEKKMIRFVDCVPLFHLSLTLAPMLEAALLQVQCQNQNCYWWHVRTTIIHQESVRAVALSWFFPKYSILITTSENDWCDSGAWFNKKEAFRIGMGWSGTGFRACPVKAVFFSILLPVI